MSLKVLGVYLLRFCFFRSLPPTRRVTQRHLGFSLFQLYAFWSLSCAPHSIRSRPSAKSFAKRFSRLTIFFFFLLVPPFDVLVCVLPLNLLHVDWRILPIDLVMFVFSSE